MLRGQDPFAGLATRREDLRSELERELRSKVLRLRGSWAAAAPNGKALDDLVVSSSGTVLALLRAALRLAGRAVPGADADVVREAASAHELDAAAVAWVLERRAGLTPPRLAPFDERAARYVEQIERLAHRVNG